MLVSDSWLLGGWWSYHQTGLRCCWLWWLWVTFLRLLSSAKKQVLFGRVHVRSLRVCLRTQFSTGVPLLSVPMSVVQPWFEGSQMVDRSEQPVERLASGSSPGRSDCEHRFQFDSVVSPLSGLFGVRNRREHITQSAWASGCSQSITAVSCSVSGQEGLGCHGQFECSGLYHQSINQISIVPISPWSQAQWRNSWIDVQQQNRWNSSMASTGCWMCWCLRGKAKSKRCVFICFLEVATEMAEQTDSGRLFQRDGAQEWTALAPVMVLTPRGLTDYYRCLISERGGSDASSMEWR